MGTRSKAAQTTPRPARGEFAGRHPIRIGGREALHLLLSVVALSLAFAWIEPSSRDADYPERLLVEPIRLAAAALAVSTGFILHELAHKVAAHHYGHFAEFRAWFRGLLVTVAVALGLGVLVAAPGAVWISGRVTPRENGLISLVGPGVNLIIAAIAYPFAWTANPEDTLPLIMETVTRVNALLAAFNLLPIGALDGRKVWRWNHWVWGIAMAISVGAVVISIAQPNGLAF